MAMIRTHIMLDPKQHRRLAQLARQQGRSVSDLAREIIQEGIDQRQLLLKDRREQRMQALLKAREVREAILQERGGVPLNLDLAELINKMREERDDEILSRGD